VRTSSAATELLRFGKSAHCRRLSGCDLRLRRCAMSSRQYSSKGPSVDSVGAFLGGPFMRGRCRDRRKQRLSVLKKPGQLYVEPDRVQLRPRASILRYPLADIDRRGSDTKLVWIGQHRTVPCLYAQDIPAADCGQLREMIAGELKSVSSSAGSVARGGTATHPPHSPPPPPPRQWSAANRGCRKSDATSVQFAAGALGAWARVTKVLQTWLRLAG